MLNRPRHPRGFTLIEATLAVLVLAFVVVASLEAGGAIARAQTSQQERQLANRFAESLTAEISSKRYVTPSDTTGLLSTPANAYDRINYLGVDSYASLSETPPRAPDGTVLTADNTWTRTTSVAYVTPATPTVTAATDSGLRRIVITVTHGGRTLARRSTLRCKDD